MLAAGCSLTKGFRAFGFFGNNKTRDVLASRVLSVKRKVAFAWLCFEGLLLVSLRDSIISMKGEVSTNFAIIITND